jgi:hypothetical protein
MCRSRFNLLRFLQGRSVFCALLLCLAGSISLAAEQRTWTSSDGKTLIASFVSAEGDKVTLRLQGGREVSLPLSRLGDADQALVRDKMKKGLAFTMKTMPEETQAPREVEVSGGPRVFRTAHFEFETDRDVSRGFIAEACRVYEGTYLALNSLPHGLTFMPPGDRTHYRGRFMNDSDFQQIASQKMPTIRGQRVVGLYLGSEQELLVPYSSLGAKSLGSRLTLRKSSDTTTLIHEIVHQVMHDWLPLIPTWFSEGIAEYIAAVPYQNGRFEFRNAERGLRERLEEQYRFDGNVIANVLPPSSFLGGYEWTGSVREYRDSMLAIYYFMHLDDPRRQGSVVGAYLRMVDSAMEDTEQVQRDLMAFEKDRLAYNEQVKKFNQKLDQFQKEVDSYNERVRLHNDQVRKGVPEEDRIVVGTIPEEPTPPKDIELPDTVRSAVREGRLDLVGMVQGKAYPALLRGRDPEEVDAAMRKAFAEMGWEVDYAD